VFTIIFPFFLKIALVAQEWFLRKDPYTTKILVQGRTEILQCKDTGYDFLAQLSYAMILLVLQLLISPFIVNSRRNYKEGLLFCCGSFSCLFVWIGWTAAFILFDNQDQHWWQDIAVCCGLVATPTVLNLVVFIPKVTKSTLASFQSFPFCPYRTKKKILLFTIVGSY
jgi:hypothetical protein